MDDKGVPLNAAITLNLESGQQHVLIRPVRGAVTQRVNFSDPTVRESFDTSVHRILISEDIKHTHPVIVLFPNHKERDNPDLQVVDSRKFSSRDSFNRVLKTRFQDSLEGQDVKMAVCYGEHVILCDGMTGTPYILWTEYIRSEKGRAAPITRNTPLIVNMDGLGIVKCIYRLQRAVFTSQDLLRMPITKKSPEFMFSRYSMPFVNESRPERTPQHRLKTISYRNAMALMTDQTVRTQGEHDYHTQELTTDGEMDAITGFMANDDCILGPDDGTVQEDPLRITQAVLAHVQNPSSTPPVLDSADEYDAGADPHK